jgi:hypothetical protein
MIPMSKLLANVEDTRAVDITSFDPIERKLYGLHGDGKRQPLPATFQLLYKTANTMAEVSDNQHQ